MRFASPLHLQPKLGWLRLRTVFLFLPARFRSRWWRWLEFAVLVEEVRVVARDRDHYAWVAIGFADEPESSTGTKYRSADVHTTGSDPNWQGLEPVDAHKTTLTADSTETLLFTGPNGGLWVFKRIPKTAQEGAIRCTDVRDLADPVPVPAGNEDRYVLVMRSVDLVTETRADLVVRVPPKGDEAIVVKSRTGPTGPANMGIMASCRFLAKRGSE